MNPSELDYTAVALAFAHVLTGVLILVAAKLARGILSPYSVDEEMTSRDNPAFGIAIAGYYAATVIIYIGAASGPGLPLDRGTAGALQQLGIDAAWAAAGILLLNASRWWLDRFLVPHFRNDEAILQQRNPAAGLLEASGFIASALVFAAAIRQPGGTIAFAFVLFAITQVALIAAARLYQALAGYRVPEEIGSGNLAAAHAFAWTLVALALLMMKAVSGEFVSWGWNLGFFAFDVVSGVVLLLGLRWVTDLVLLPRARLAEEIARDRNLNAGLLEGVLAVGIAALILFLF